MSDPQPKSGRSRSAAARRLADAPLSDASARAVRRHAAHPRKSPDHARQAPRPGDGRAGHRLRRHRHQPALRAQGVLRARPRGARRTQRGQRAGGAVAGLLVADGGGRGEVPGLHHAADNKGEGGIFALLALVPANATARSPRMFAVLLGAVRGLAALRRRHHHARDLGALGGRGPRGGATAAIDSCRRAHHLRHPGRALPGPEARHRRHRRGLRPGHALWFVTIACSAIALHRPQPRRARGAQPAATRSAFFRRAPPARLLRARLRRALHHRRRGALRRHGPLRRAADPAGVVRAGLPGAAAQLLRPGRAAPGSATARSRTRSTRSRPGWCCTRWSHSPPRPRSSPRRPSSRARSRSPGRRCSSGTSRG